MKKKLNTYRLRIELAKADLKPHEFAKLVGISRQRLHYMVSKQAASNPAIVDKMEDSLGLNRGSLVL